MNLEIVKENNEITLKHKDYAIIINKSNVFILKFNKEINEYEEIEVYYFN